MNNLVNSISNSITLSSLEIAELTGKRHDHVLRDLQKLNKAYEKLYLPKIELILKTTDLGFGRSRKDPCCQLTKMQTWDLLTGYNTELRIKVNRRWAELEERQTLHLPAPTTYNGIKLIPYIGWLLKNNYSIIGSRVNARIRKYPEQFIKDKNGCWYMSEAIANYFLSFKERNYLPGTLPGTLPKIHNQLEMFNT